MSESPRPPVAALAADTAPVTRVGIDAGVNNLAVAAPASAGPTVGDVLVINGDVERALYKELGATLHRLEVTTSNTDHIERAVITEYRNALQACFATATADVLDYLERFERPILAVEELGKPYRSLNEDRGQVDAGNWLMPAFQRRLVNTAESTGYTVEYVDPNFTTQECHLCGKIGDRVRNRDIECSTPGCPVGKVNRDRSAAVSIAKRADPAETPTSRQSHGIEQ